MAEEFGATDRPDYPGTERFLGSGALGAQSGESDAAWDALVP